MNSAFGIDHGDVSKAAYSYVSPRARRRKAALKQQAAANQAARSARVQGALTRIAGAPRKAANTKVSIADVGRGASKPVTALGRVAGRYPGATGAAVLGAGGYVAYRGMQRESLPKKKTVKV